MAILALLALTLFWLGHLVIERVRLETHRDAVPLRIAVTGTRGKTSVTRMLAAVLRQTGRTVLAKTTGSEAVTVLPDGSEAAIHRRGRPSIIEQKKLLARAANLDVDALVAEIMSIHPENHRVEARALVQPHVVLVTNFRVDHVDAQGATKKDVAAVLALDVPPGARAFVPESEWQPDFAARVERNGGTVERVRGGTAAAAGLTGHPTGNLDLIVAAARFLGIADGDIRAGAGEAHGDLGMYGAWRYPRTDGREPCLVVNAFAANDPESTFQLYDRVGNEHGVEAGTFTGLLSLRADRGERTLQWANALAAGGLDRFRRLFVVGLHANALQWRLRHAPGERRVRVLRRASPAEVMKRILEADDNGPGLVFGFGNMGGLGEMMVRHWRKAGESHGV